MVVAAPAAVVIRLAEVTETISKPKWMPCELRMPDWPRRLRLWQEEVRIILFP
jgi:hypothetical protein